MCSSDDVIVVQSYYAARTAVTRSGDVRRRTWHVKDCAMARIEVWPKRNGVASDAYKSSGERLGARTNASPSSASQ